jgi:uncharacterized protein (TIGR04255 family)
VPRYLHPPLMEAIYEVFVKDAPGWSVESARGLENTLLPSFVGQREEVNLVNLNIHLGPTGQPSTVVAPDDLRTRLWNSNRTSLVQFSSQMAALNVLPGAYTQYEEQEPQLSAFFAAYLAASQPTALAWLGQRYINKIVLPVGARNAGDYFQFYPRFPSSVHHRTFALQVVLDSFEGGEVVLNFTCTGQKEEQPTYFLDISARSTVYVAPNVQNILRWQSTAHQAIRRAFSLALTDDCRRLFEEVSL